MKLYIGRLLGMLGMFAGAGFALGACASEADPQGATVGETAEELQLTTGGVYDGKDIHASQCTVNNIQMHCCPTGRVMTGANLDRGFFKCTPPAAGFNITLGTPFIDGQDGVTNHMPTQRQGMHACPIQAVMVGYHQGRNDLLCAYVNTDHGLQENVDTGTQEPSMPGHVCPPANGSPSFAGTSYNGKVMSGIDAGANRFLCAN